MTCCNDIKTHICWVGDINAIIFTIKLKIGFQYCRLGVYHQISEKYI
jgi:hypothetical protein